MATENDTPFSYTAGTFTAADAVKWNARPLAELLDALHWCESVVPPAPVTSDIVCTEATWAEIRKQIPVHIATLSRIILCGIPVHVRPAYLEACCLAAKLEVDGRRPTLLMIEDVNQAAPDAAVIVPVPE